MLTWLTAKIKKISLLPHQWKLVFFFGLLVTLAIFTRKIMVLIKLIWYWKVKDQITTIKKLRTKLEYGLKNKDQFTQKWKSFRQSCWRERVSLSVYWTPHRCCQLADHMLGIIYFLASLILPSFNSCLRILLFSTLCFWDNGKVSTFKFELALF